MNTPMDITHAQCVEYQWIAAQLVGNSQSLMHNLTMPRSSVVVERFSGAYRIMVLFVMRQIQA